MNDAIKTISLDDVADIQAQNDKVGAKGGALGGNPKMTVPVATRFGETRNNGYLGTNTNLQFIKVYRPRFYSSALSRFSEILGERFNTPLKKRMAAALVGLSLAVTLVFSLSTDEARQSSLEELRKFLNTVLSFGEKSGENKSNHNASVTESDSASHAVPVSPATVPNPDNLLNPYWSMPNPLTIAPEEGPIGTLSSTQEERWRQELQHPFTWQRYKTVMEMRRARLKGSQYLLAEALVQPKFWTRMEAVLGLADLGEAADIESIESALGTAPPALVQNYFRRFSRGYTAGELYVMRQAVRLVDAGARLIILQSLAQNRNATNDLYLVAATYDSNGKIKTWIDEELMRSPIGAHVKEEFNHIIATSESDQGATQDAHKLDSAESSKIHDLKIEKMQDNVNVEDVYFLKDEDVQPVHKEAVPVDDGFQEIENSAKKRKIKH